MRSLAELRGSCASFKTAAKRSSIGNFLFFTIARRRWRLPAYFFASRRRISFFSIMLFLAISCSFCSASEAFASLPEGKVEGDEKRARLVVGLRRRTNRDVHAPDFGRLVEVDLGENDVFLEAEGVVAPAIETLRIEPAEIAHARQRDVHKPVDEFVHARAPQRDLGADPDLLAELE